MQKITDLFSINIMFFLILAVLSLLLMGTIFNAQTTNELNQTAWQMADESSEAISTHSENFAFAKQGVILRANVIKY